MTAVMRDPRGGDDAADMASRPISRSTSHSRGPFARLRRQHRGMLVRLSAFERGLRAGRRQRCDERAFRSLARWLTGAFTVHVSAEEGVLYPALIRELPELALTLEPLRADHAELDHMAHSMTRLLAVVRSPARDEQLVVLGRDLVDLMRLHIRHEERSVLDWCERVLPPDTLRELQGRLSRVLGRS
jgi:hemerythrin-like domain-containing protein